MLGIALSQRIAAAMAPLPWRMLETAGRPDLDALIEALYRSLVYVVDETFSKTMHVIGAQTGPAPPEDRTALGLAPTRNSRIVPPQPRRTPKRYPISPAP